MKKFFAAIMVALFVVFSLNSASAQFKKNQSVNDCTSVVVNNHIEVQAAAPACTTLITNNREVVRHDTIVVRTGSPAGQKGQKNSFQSFKESAQFGLDSFKDGARFGVDTHKEAWEAGYAAGLAAGKAACCTTAATTPNPLPSLSDNPLFWWLMGLAATLLALMSYWVGRADQPTPPTPPTPPTTPPAGTTPPTQPTPPVVTTPVVTTTPIVETSKKGLDLGPPK